MKKCFGVILTLVAVLALVACGGKQPAEETADVPQEPRGPDYQVFAPLPRAVVGAAVPYLTDEGGLVDTPCFKPVAELEPVEADIVLRDTIEQNEADALDAIRSWLVEDVAPAGLTSGIAGGWSIEMEDLVVLETPVDQLRFVEDQECISAARGWLPEGVRAVTTLFGARALHFTTDLPVGQDLQQELLSELGMFNIVMESEALFVYEPALDEDGNQLTNDKDELLFQSPSGLNIPQSEIPPSEQRTMKEWTLSAEQPIYFGFHEIPDDAWRKESEKDKCDVYLVWGDITPRTAECPEFQDSAFSATQTDDGQVAITITTDGENRGVVMEFGKGQKLDINDRVMLWISPKKIEEGVMLRLNSLVLDPQPMDGGEEAEDAVPMRAPQVDDEEELPAEKKSKKNKKSTGNAIDDYLN
jgi:hypothetical protein